MTSVCAVDGLLTLSSDYALLDALLAIVELFFFAGAICLALLVVWAILRL